MPIYEYQCPQCGHVFEEWVRVSTASDTAQCPACEATATHIISNTAFILKGGGWYVTEYGSHKSGDHGKEGAEGTSKADAVNATCAPDAKTSADAVGASDAQSGSHTTNTDKASTLIKNTEKSAVYADTAKSAKSGSSKSAT